MILDKIRIILVNTSHPGNIGAAARVMKNMGLKRLYLVDPKFFPDAEATSMASGADDLLAQAIVCEQLDEALQGCQLVLGTTARERKIQHEIINAREAGLLAVAEAVDFEIAIVFGRERTGLTNQETGLCHKLVNIPTNPDFSSLNVASAVQILCYEVLMAATHGSIVRDKKMPEKATADEMERFYQHLEVVLINIGFLRLQQSPQLMPKLRNLYNRSRLEKDEVNILRGILTETNKLTRNN